MVPGVKVKLTPHRLHVLRGCGQTSSPGGFMCSYQVPPKPNSRLRTWVGSQHVAVMSSTDTPLTKAVNSATPHVDYVRIIMASCLPVGTRDALTHLAQHANAKNGHSRYSLTSPSPAWGGEQKAASQFNLNVKELLRFLGTKEAFRQKTIPLQSNWFGGLVTLSARSVIQGKK